MRVCRGVRPLFVDGKNLYCSKGSKLLATTDGGATFDEVARIQFQGKFSGFAGIPLAARVLRMHPYRLVPVGDSSFVFQAKPGTYTVGVNSQSQRVFPVTSGSRPTSLAKAADGLIVFGDYIPNVDRKSPVRIMGSDDSGVNWKELYTFAPGVVRHIHGISYDKWLNCFWICTGDYPDESVLWKASHDFSSVAAVIKGSAMTRFYSIAVTEKLLIMSTDSPSVQNYIYVVDKETGTAKRVAEIQNSSFYHAFCGDRLFISTNCEFPDLHAEVTCHNDVVCSHVWAADPPYENWREVLNFRSAFEYGVYRKPFTYGVFQYPRVFFPDGENATEYCFMYMLGLKPHPDSMLVYNAADL